MIPPTIPRHPAWMAASPAGPATRTGTQSAVITDSASPDCLGLQRVPLAAEPRPRRQSTVAEWTCFAHAIGGAPARSGAAPPRALPPGPAGEAHLDVAEAGLPDPGVRLEGGAVEKGGLRHGWGL